jgi:hypothetical protein
MGARIPATRCHPERSEGSLFAFDFLFSAALEAASYYRFPESRPRAATCHPEAHRSEGSAFVFVLRLMRGKNAFPLYTHEIMGGRG